MSRRLRLRGKAAIGVAVGIGMRLLSWSSCALADPGARDVLYGIVVGQNDAPAAADPEATQLAPLHYADDDAVQIHLLLRGLGATSYLLTVPDQDTQTRFPEVAQVAAPPRKDALERAVNDVSRAMLKDRAEGRQPSLIFFFSGHGVRSADGVPGLTLADGVITEQWLYDELVARVPARFIHLIVDACHAAAVVRSRDVSATLEPVTPAQAEHYLATSTLARFPQVGAILASTSSSQSFEWDGYRAGIFAHELISALRGAADVNGDRVVEYSEVAAFLAAANVRVADARARLRIVAQPPRLDAHAPVVDLRKPPSGFELVGRSDAPWNGRFYVETERGARLVDALLEPGTAVRLWLPDNEPLYVVRGEQEARVSAAAGARLELSSLRLGPVRSRSRGSLESSLRRGLFETRFGPAYYLGYTSERDDLLPVQLPDAATTASEKRDSPPPRAPDVKKPLGWAFVSLAGAATVGAGVFGVLAAKARSDYDDAAYERTAETARADFKRYRTTALVSAGVAATFGAAGATLLLWRDSPTTASSGRLRAELGGVFLDASF